MLMVVRGPRVRVGVDSLRAKTEGTGVPHIRKRTPLGPYRRPMPGVLGGS